MLYLRFSIALVAVFFAGLVSYAQQSAPMVPDPGITVHEQAEAAATSASLTIPDFGDSPHGLESLMRKMFELEKSGGAKNLPYFQSLELQDSNVWFTQVFGGKSGGEFSRDYEGIRPRMAALLSNTIADLAKRGLTKPTAVELKDPCDQRATPGEYALLLARRTEEPLYVVRFVQNNTLTEVPFFAYVDGGFRYIGNIQADSLGLDGGGTGSTAPAATPGDVPERLRVGGNAMQKKLRCQAMPQYPGDAKAQHIQGTVLLHVIIDKEGCQLISGDRELAESAAQAVRQWQYRPTLLNGKPVEVDTTISVVFTLGG